ncbi:MAG: class I SAM-dependent rRNA methyltransferase [Candidatus Limnocylindrales bacterium]
MTHKTEEPNGPGYELLDAGVRRRLERFGPLTIDRPAASADGFRLSPDAWSMADLRFDPGTGWSRPALPADSLPADSSPADPSPTEPWPVVVDGLTMELRPTDSGGVGLYPEHAANLAWLTAQVVARADVGGPVPPQVLNLFAHTGLATLALARAGAAVAHVDGARSAVAWARRNAELSGLADRPVRWLVDDAAGFVAREARRGRLYDGLVLDPPAFGRAGGREWRLEEDLPDLLAACRAVAAPGAFVLLTAHSESVDGGVLASALRTGFGSGAAEVVPLDLTATSGARLALGWSVRRAS